MNMPNEVWFGHEKLAVYQEAIAFIAWLSAILEGSVHLGEVKDQLDSLGVNGVDLSSLQMAIVCQNQSGAADDCTDPLATSFVVCARAHARSMTGLLGAILDNIWVSAVGTGPLTGTATTIWTFPRYPVDPTDPPPCGSPTVTYSTTNSDGSGPDNGSAPVDHNSPYPVGATVTVLGNGTPPLVLPGYNFYGWCTTDNATSPTQCTGTSYQPNDTFTISENVTLYALWS